MDGNERSNGHKPASQRGKAKWTVMVYLAGDNNLTANCITVLQQLEAVKYSDDVCVLACFDSNTPWPKGSRYLAINGKWIKNNGDLDWELYNDLILARERGHDIKAPDFCGDDKVQGRRMKRTDVAEGLKRFIHWAVETQRKADHYMLVLYGHGPVVAGKTFLAQENPLSSVRMQDLPKILAPHFGNHRRRKLDILAFQNCAMNGVETAYEVKDQVNYMIGSQGLVLAYGWPYDKIISAVVENRNDTPLQITEKVLKACARHLIDFSVMDRSSEQSACDLSKLRNGTNVTDAISELGAELQEALGFKEVRATRKSEDTERMTLKYPIICDAVRLARLEAQSYWGETFVDVYDFCERLLKKCQTAVVAHNDLVNSLGLNETQLRETPFVTQLRTIMRCCNNVMERVKGMVPYSYYIGSELQYSHGLSIYFPWSMPGEPYSFYFRKKYREHVLVTAFETYRDYEFVKASGWADFLRSFYKATLRNVRRADRKFRVNQNLHLGMVRENYTPQQFIYTTEYLQKTDSNSGTVDYDVWSNVKNYPRRNYLSPSDCPRKVKEGGRHHVGESAAYPNPFSTPVSYLGWNICEFVADVIRKKPGSNNGSSQTKLPLRQKAESKLLQRELETTHTHTRRR